ncbi:MAG: urease accessory UreF family protein [Steroidobacteraceae bacterium]
MPVGAYAYSQGLEYAVEAGWVRDEATTHEWLQGLMRHSLAQLDLPLLIRLLSAAGARDGAALRSWNARLLASRETQELRDEDRQLGRALCRVLIDLQIPGAEAWRDTPAGYATQYALACAHWQISERAALAGYTWSWLENQVLAAVKLVPLGQSAGQRLLHALALQIEACVVVAQAVGDADIGIGGVMQGLASAAHESQYTRLFRS